MMDSDMKIAHDTLAMLAIKRNMSFAGVIIGGEPLQFYIVGNVTQRGHQLAKLFREYADFIDGGETQFDTTPISKAN